MKHILDTQEKQLDNLFAMIDILPEDEIKSCLAKHLCVRTSGFVENAVKTLISNYTEGSCPKRIESFVLRKIKTVTNLSDDKITEFLRNFSDEWARDFDNQISDKQRSSLNTVISNRNNIAHGQNDNISFHYMKQYYLDVKEIVVLLKTIIKR